MWSRKIPFKVDIAGVIEIMGTSLYSRPDTPIRELLQNAHDAIMRRRARDLTYQGRIDVRQDSVHGTLVFEDDGIGLSPQEAEDYLGTLGIGITGILKGWGSDNRVLPSTGTGDQLIGQFGIGLFSAFMLADSMVVESRRVDCEQGVRWEAGAGTEIDISSSDRTEIGTRVTLRLKPEFARFCVDSQILEEAIKQYADFLPIPIYINQAGARSNIIQASWFDPTPDNQAIELEFANYFGETPLEVIPLAIEKPASIHGALYVSPQRTPGFADDAVVAVTVRRMVISRRIHDLIPAWAPFLRGVLELPDCSPTSNREDLVRDPQFEQVCNLLDDYLFAHFEQLSFSAPPRWQSILNWHRYTFAGMAVYDARLRGLLRRCYHFLTSQGDLTFEQILERSQSDALLESEFDYVVWYNADRRQEAWLNDLFAGQEIPCVHTLRSFEEPLLAAMMADLEEQTVDLRTASPSSSNFSVTILGLQDTAPATSQWSEFFQSLKVNVMTASLRTQQPALAFINERYELSRTFDELRHNGDIPSGFQRLIDQHFQRDPAGANDVILNINHRLVRRALTLGVRSPLASVLRVLVIGALSKAGAKVEKEAQSRQAEDLEWIADALWGKDHEAEA